MGRGQGGVRTATLGREAIAAAGLRLIDRDGAAKFSMRSVAAEVGAAPMSLYHHVADRSELVALMIDASLREVPMPEPSGEGWRHDLWAVALWLRGTAQRHPGLREVTGDISVATPAMLAFGEYWVSLWRQSGLQQQHADDAAMVTLGGVVAMVLHQGQTVGSQQPRLSELPHLRHAILVAPESDEAYEIFVRGLIDGVFHRMLGLGPEGAI